VIELLPDCYACGAAVGVDELIFMTLPSHPKTAPVLSTVMLAPGHSIRALASDGSAAARFRWAYQSSISLQGVVMLRTTFPMLRRPFLMLQTVVLATFKEYMLRACCECVVSMLRTRLRATSNMRSLSPLPPCCDYITNMLRPVLHATSNIKGSPHSPPQHKI
jgi:hypothetical protein